MATLGYIRPNMAILGHIKQNMAWSDFLTRLIWQDKFLLQMPLWWTVTVPWAECPATGAVVCAVNGPWNGENGAATELVSTPAATMTTIIATLSQHPSHLAAQEAPAMFLPPLWPSSTPVSFSSVKVIFPTNDTGIFIQKFSQSIDINK